MKKITAAISTAILALILAVVGSSTPTTGPTQSYYEVHNGKPYFLSEDYAQDCFEFYSPLDELGRCGYAMACVCANTLPTEGRGSISGVKPTGWHTVTYPEIIADRYLYNRCHLLGWQLTAENANVCNLITGTRFLNVEGMLPWENKVADFLKQNPEAHVLYRVTPIFEDENLVATGVFMEAADIETQGAIFAFCVYCPNIQPGIVIDYATGDSWLADTQPTVTPTAKATIYVINLSSGTIHYETCGSVKQMSEKNKLIYVGDFDSLLEAGYHTCGKCSPK